MIYAKIQTNRAVLYPYSPHERKLCQENLQLRHRFANNFSKKVRSKLMEIVEVWDLVVKYAKSIGKNVKLRFVTLTLPVKQKHCDKTIVRVCLLPFLKSIGRYLYVCEKQENGNIHFHCIIDAVIPASQLRKMWNIQLESLLLISEYQESRKELYANGFVFLDNGFSLVQQQLWYAYGVSTNWRNPHTIDIRDIEEHENVGRYISKYITKGQNFHLCCNRWGKSADVGRLSSPKVDDMNYTNDDIDYLLSLSSSIHQINEFVTIIESKGLINNLVPKTKLKMFVDVHFLVQAQFFYP